MAARFWVGGSGNWDSTTTHWSTTSGGVSGASAPTSSDDVTFNVSSNATAYTCTMAFAGTVNCASLNIAAPGSGKVTIAGTSTTLNIFGSLNLSGGTAGITWSHTNGAINFKATGTGQTISQNGLSFASAVSFDGVGGGWTLSDAFATTVGATTLTNGTLDTNGKTVSAIGFSSSNSNTRSLTLGASIVNIQSSTWNLGTVTTGLTFSGASSTINTGGFTSPALTYGTVSITGTVVTTPIGVPNGCTFGTLNLTGGAVNGTTYTSNGDITCSTVFNINGTSVANRAFLGSSVKGTQRTITAASVTGSYFDLQDIIGAGASGWNVSAVTGGSGDCLGNSGITFTSPTTQHWVTSAGGNWGTTANWTSRVPLPQDTVVMDCAFGVSVTVTADKPRLGVSVDWSGATFTTALTFAGFSNGAIFTTTYGNFTWLSGMTTDTAQNDFEGRSGNTLITNGVTINGVVRINCVTGNTYTLGDNMTLASARATLVLTGTLDTSVSSHVLSTGSMTLSAGGTFNQRTATHLLTGTGTVFSGGGTVSGTGTFKINNTSNTAITFAGAGSIFSNIWFSRGASTASNTITGSNTFVDIKDDGTVAHSLLFTAGTTTVFTTWNVSGTTGNLITVTSAAASTSTHILSCTTGVISADYLAIAHSVAQGGATFYAGTHSTNNQATATAGSGWIFTAPPSSNSAMLAFF